MTKTQKAQKTPAKMLVVAIDRLVPTPDNRRKAISDASVKSLAQSIRREGLLQPIVVRPHPAQADCFEIRAGERRWRAARLAGLGEVPIAVRSLDNEQALSVTIAENMLRKDLHPLEEAEAIQLAFAREYDLKALAARLGKSVAYLARRASLCRLSKRWRREILKRDSEAGRLSAAHLELIARLPESTQDTLAEEDFWPVFGRGFPTVGELRRVIDGALRSLEAMPWNPKDETLDPKAGACASCPKRSSQHPLLFPESDAAEGGHASKQDRCLDPDCFDRKHIAFLHRCECKHRSVHPELRIVHMGGGSISQTVQESFGDRLEHLYAPKLVKAGHPNAVAVMQVEGPKAGKVVYLSLENSVQSHRNGRTGRPRDAEGKAVPLSLTERRTRLQKRRDAYVVKQVGEFLRNLTPEKATEIVTARSKARDDGDASEFDAVALSVAFGSTKRADYVDGGGAWKDYNALRQASPVNQWAAVLRSVAPVWIKRLNMQSGHTVSAQAEDARRMCPFLGLSFCDLAAEARRSIPQPKSWATCEEPDPPAVSAEPIENDAPCDDGDVPFEVDPPAEPFEVAVAAGERN